MGKGWDCEVPGEAFAREALRVLKPGGHLIAFAATRTVHRLTVALEDAGFEVRDQIGWLQWQGFPKSLDVSKAIDKGAGAEREVVGRGASGKTAIGGDGGRALGGTDGAQGHDLTTPATPDAQRWAGWGTALKPAQEPAILCRKPLEGTVAENVLKWGTGGINIDGCRIGYGDSAWPGPGDDFSGAVFIGSGDKFGGFDSAGSDVAATGHALGRWPANIYHTPKPSRGEREEGCGGLQSRSREDVTGRKAGSAGQQHARSGMTRTGEIGNHHPTVKPVALMRWLVRLVTPRGGVVLEPFAGSGTTLVAAEREAFDCLGFEREPAYCDIIRARVAGALNGGAGGD
jgi:site-specific DNA-methyltransferase (adenine-specific)